MNHYFFDLFIDDYLNWYFLDDRFDHWYLLDYLDFLNDFHLFYFFDRGTFFFRRRSKPVKGRGSFCRERSTSLAVVNFLNNLFFDDFLDYLFDLHHYRYLMNNRNSNVHLDWHFLNDPVLI